MAAISCLTPFTEITNSMRRAIDETERRRAKQMAFNQANGIVPRGVVKRIKDIIDGVYDADAAQQARKVAEAAAAYAALDEKALAKEIKRLEKDMQTAARDLQFERAAELRDRLLGLKKQLFGVEVPDLEG